MRHGMSPCAPPEHPRPQRIHPPMAHHVHYRYVQSLESGRGASPAPCISPARAFPAPAPVPTRASRGVHLFDRRQHERGGYEVDPGPRVAGGWGVGPVENASSSPLRPPANARFWSNLAASPPAPPSASSTPAQPRRPSPAHTIHPPSQSLTLAPAAPRTRADARHATTADRYSHYPRHCPATRQPLALHSPTRPHSVKKR
jgi:hypothetical protein